MSSPLPSDLMIRPAEVSEREMLESLQRRASLANEDHRATLLAHLDAIKLPAEHLTEGCTLVAERAGNILGFSVILARDDGEAELDGLFVEPHAWRSSIGTLLIAESSRVAALKGATWLWVVCGKITTGFYAKCGFEKVGESDTRFEMAVSMRKRISVQHCDSTSHSLSESRPALP